MSGTLITLILFSTTVFDGNPSRATKAAVNKDTLIVEPSDANGQDTERGQGGNPQPDDADSGKKDMGKTGTGIDSQDSGKGKVA